MASGGIIANNARQGRRAEYLAKYVLSEFGPCEQIMQENDSGVDLVGTLMKKVGKMGLTFATYGIQVKSGGEGFKYTGEQAMNWLKEFNIPLILCRVDRATATISLYSTWTLHYLILKDGDKDINEISFVEEYGDGNKLKMPEVQDKKAMVWVGKPIISISVMQLANSDYVYEIGSSLEEWVVFDLENYANRRIDIPIIFGYIKWETNKSLKTSQRIWYKPYFFGCQKTVNAINRITNCAVVIALNEGKDAPIVKDMVKFIEKYGKDFSSFVKDKLGIP